jgi:hypothetical protein
LNLGATLLMMYTRPLRLTTLQAGWRDFSETNEDTTFTGPISTCPFGPVNAFFQGEPTIFRSLR